VGGSAAPDNWITEAEPKAPRTFVKARFLLPSEPACSYIEVTDEFKAQYEAREEPPQWFIDYWNRRCEMFTAHLGKYNKFTKFFELNGIKDITYGHAIYICLYSDAWNVEESNRTRGTWQTWNMSMKTNFPKYGVLQGACINTYNTRIDRIRLQANADGSVAVAQLNLSSLSTIYEIVDNLSLVNCSYFDCKCKTLRHIKLGNFNFDISLANCALLDIESFQYMVQYNGNSKPITVTVHSDVYAKLTDVDNAEWHKVLTDGAAKNITFAVAAS